MQVWAPMDNSRLAALNPSEYMNIYTLQKVREVSPEPYIPYELSTQCAKLRREGYLRYDEGYVLTDKGHEKLREYE